MKIKELREKTGLNQTITAQKLNIPRVNYNKYENEEVEPNIATLIKLAKYFNVSLDELCGCDISQSKADDIKKYSDIKNKCYNTLVSLTDEQATLTYTYMQWLTKQEL